MRGPRSEDNKTEAALWWPCSNNSFLLVAKTAGVPSRAFAVAKVWYLKCNAFQLGLKVIYRCR